jgi:hypothetical protein
MVATIVLMTTLTAASEPGPHVRSSLPRIAALLIRGVECSSTVRHLVATLDASDVIVYIEPKQRRPSLSGYLSHQIVTVAGIRYLRIYVEIQGAEKQLISLIGHELQHAVEVAQTADARTSADVKRVFDRLGVSLGCHAADCYETRAARDVERAIRRELHEASPSCNRDSHETSGHKACRVCADEVSGER